MSVTARVHQDLGTVEDVMLRRAESLAAEQVEEDPGDMMSLLLFTLDPEWYAVEVSSVREVFTRYAVTSVPCAPPFVRGVITIRGEILSVTDLRRLLRLSADVERAEWPVIVVANDSCATALAVDGIGDIVDLPRDAVEPAVSTLDKSQGAFVAGSVFVDGKLVGLLDLDEILTPIGVEA
jgi:purine-binding chemotaxis protein CheW